MLCRSLDPHQKKCCCWRALIFEPVSMHNPCQQHHDPETLIACALLWAYQVPGQAAGDFIMDSRSRVKMGAGTGYFGCR